MSQHKAHGFTLIELMLAMSFVSVLLVSVAMLTIQIGHLYTRGVTMKEINQAGTEISDDIRRSIAESYADKIKTKEFGGKKLICTGIYTYIANSPEQIETNDAGLVKYANDSVIRFAKVRDVGGTYCTSLPLRLPSNVDTTELLGGDRSLVVRKLDLRLSSFPSDGDQALYLLTLTLSSGATSELTAAGTCLTPNSDQSGGEYCAIDTFDIVARAGNTVGN